MRYDDFEGKKRLLQQIKKIRFENNIVSIFLTHLKFALCELIFNIMYIL